MFFMNIKDENDLLKVERLYNEYRNLLYTIAYDILKDQQLAEDAIHDVFMRVIRYLDRFKDDDCVRTRNFLATICRNIAIDSYNKRSKLKETALPEEYYDEANAALLTISDPQEIFSRKDSLQLLANSVTKLSPVLQGAFVLKYIYGFNTEEIADILDIKEETAKKRITRAKAKIIELCQKGESYDER